MSVVLVTDLPAGDTADSADVNATLDSFTNGTAAGSLVGVNVRMEGVDRRTLDINGGVVSQGNSGGTYFQDTGSGAVSSVAYAVIPLGGGASPMVMPAAITAPVSARLILHASVRVTKAAIAATANLPRVWCELEQSVDGGGVYTKITGSERSISMRQTDALCDPTPGNAVPGISQTISWSQYVATTNVATLYRVTYRTVNGTFSFNDGVITPEVILR